MARNLKHGPLKRFTAQPLLSLRMFTKEISAITLIWMCMFVLLATNLKSLEKNPVTQHLLSNEKVTITVSFRSTAMNRGIQMI